MIQNLNFTKKLESTQYSAALAVTGAWCGTNTDRLYEELGWESFTTDGDKDACVTFTDCEVWLSATGGAGGAPKTTFSP